MSLTHNLWLLRMRVPHLYANEIASLLDDDILSLTILAPPRKDEALLEALYNYEPSQAELVGRLSIKATLLRIESPHFEITQLEDINWVQRVATDHGPRKIGLFRIASSGELTTPDRPIRNLTIDASSAFGTGDHPTTEGCLLMLDWLIKHKRGFEQILDIGCGSGILALAAAKALKVKVYGIDIDPQSVAIAKTNVKENGLAAFIRIQKGNGLRGAGLKKARPFNLIMANIFARPLAQLAPSLASYLAPNGIVILAGLLCSQENLVLSAYRRKNIYLLKRTMIGEWSILALQQKSSS